LRIWKYRGGRCRHCQDPVLHLPCPLCRHPRDGHDTPTVMQEARMHMAHSPTPPPFNDPPVPPVGDPPIQDPPPSPGQPPTEPPAPPPPHVAAHGRRGQIWPASERFNPRRPACL